MNANDLTFGIELETIAPDRLVREEGLRIGPYRRGVQVPYLPEGWKAEADGSIDNGHGGHKCEIVSPVLRGPEGLAQVAAAVRTLEAKGHRVNASTGVHIHVGWHRDWDSAALAPAAVPPDFKITSGLREVTFLAACRNRRPSLIPSI